MILFEYVVDSFLCHPATEENILDEIEGTVNAKAAQRRADVRSTYVDDTEFSVAENENNYGYNNGGYNNGFENELPMGEAAGQDGRTQEEIDEELIMQLTLEAIENDRRYSQSSFHSLTLSQPQFIKTLSPLIINVSPYCNSVTYSSNSHSEFQLSRLAHFFHNDSR